MDQKTGGHTAAFLKRQAKNIKKAQGIPHRMALDQAAVAAGFANWANFVNKTKVADVVKNTSSNSPLSKTSSRQTTKSSDTIKNPYRKLLVSAINELLQRGLISLKGTDDIGAYDSKGHVIADLFGYPSVIMWADIGFEELRISVWWKYNHSLHPQANLTGNARESFNCSTPLANKIHYKKFVGITVSGWLERKTGKYLQGENSRGIFDIYTRSGEKAELDQIASPEPMGFESEGKFHF